MILEMTRVVQAGIRQEKKLELIANHLANVNTTGFKSDIISFGSKKEKLPVDCTEFGPPCSPCSSCPPSIRMELLKPLQTIDLTQGDIVVTDNELDLALTDEGFFKIETQYGIRYTRNGNFSLDNEGTLVTQNGDAVLGERGKITIRGLDVNIDQEGNVRVDEENVGNISVVTFNDLEKLLKEGDSLFKYNGQDGMEIKPQTVSVKQGALERSNVSSVTEMTKMIETHRMYEAYQKVIHSFDEMNSTVISQVGKI